MKRYSLLFPILAAVVATAVSCVNLDDIEGRVSKLENRMNELERTCQKYNENIVTMDALASVLTGYDVITDISEIKENGEVVGYAITFSKSGVKRIYNGAKGKDGTDGTDGVTPEFKIVEGYWYVRYGDGEWMMYGQATGDAGAPGSSGGPGAPGITPEFKIVEGYWYVRYGDGEWINYGQATGDTGKPGLPGDSGVTPEFQIIDGYWYVRYGEGEWTQCGKATGDSNPGGQGEPGLTPEFQIIDGYWYLRYGDGEWVNYGQATGDKGDSGKDAPVIGIVPGEGGAYYWTLDGEIMLDNAGNPFTAGGQNGITPELKIEDDYWWVRYGSGQWTRLGKAKGDKGDPGEGTIGPQGPPGQQGDSMFESVTSDGSSLTVVLADGGGTFVIPVTADLAISFAATTVPAAPGATINISYTITSTTGSADIEVMPTSGLKAKVATNGLKGTITVVVGPTVDFEYDKVVVIVTNGTKTLLKKITFSERGRIEVTDEHTTSLMTCKGGTVNFNIAANVDYVVSITSGGSPVTWVRHIGTRALTPYSLDFSVDPNTGGRRMATITISSSETDDKAEFTVIQYASTGSFVVTNTGGEAKMPTVSGNNLSGLVVFEGEVEEWTPGISHNYGDAAAHRAEYFIENAVGFSMENLSGLVNLNVKDF